MKKITLNLVGLLTLFYGFGQTFSTGELDLNSINGTDLNYFAQIDVSPSLVTVTLKGPTTGWLGIGFNNTSMANSGDVIIFDGNSITDRSFNGFGVIPVLDTQQDWTLVSNTVNSNVRTVVGTRALDTGEAGDYVFTNSAQALSLVYARRLSDFTIDYHGSNSCGTISSNFTLGNNVFEKESFKMYPNPSKGNVTIEMPEQITTDGDLKIYDQLGRVVKKVKINELSSDINISDLEKGNYLVYIRTDYGNSSKSLIIE